MLSIERIESAIKDVFERNEVFNHSIKVISGNPKTLEICLARRNQEVDLDFCEKVSKEISDILDSIDNSDDAYMLDVCSFGAERELVDDQDIADNVSNYVHADFYNPQAGLDKVEGTLVEFVDNNLTIAYMDKTVKRKITVNKENIKLIRLAVKL